MKSDWSSTDLWLQAVQDHLGDEIHVAGISGTRVYVKLADHIIGVTVNRGSDEPAEAAAKILKSIGASQVPIKLVLRERPQRVSERSRSPRRRIKSREHIDMVPPRNAEFWLHVFLPVNRVDDCVGDLQERFRKKVERLGRKRAVRWYYTQVARSLWPYFRAWVMRTGSGAFLMSVCFVLRLFGQGQLADALIQSRKQSINKR